MIQKPNWNTLFRVERHKPDRLFLFSDTGQYVLNGELYYQVAPLINGKNSVKEIANQINSIPFYKIHHVVNRLANQGYVVETADDLPQTIVSICHALQADITLAKTKLTNTRFFISSIDKEIKTNALTDIFQQTHLQITSERSEADLCLILTNDYLHPQIETYHQYFFENKIAWMLLKPNSAVPWIGPLFDSNQQKCWACLSQRIKHHRRLEKTLDLGKQRPGLYTPPILTFPPLNNMVFNLVTTEVIKWLLTGENKTLTDHLTTIDLREMEMKRHVFVKRPQCTACGDPEIVAKRTQQAIVLRPHIKEFTSDGGHRTVTPAETVDRIEHHISNITGVVSQLSKCENTKAPTSLINNYSTGFNVRTDFSDYKTLRAFLVSSDAGKGATDVQSKASGLCEAIERYSGSFHGHEHYIHATYRELGNKAIHPNDYLNFSHAQYETRNSISNSNFYEWVTPRFDEEKRIKWTPLWSLTTNTFKYMPTALCYYGGGEMQADSNGCAAGNTLEEAILQGFLELVERDSIALWWYNRVQRPSVDLLSFNNSYINQLKEYYESLNRDLWALDITSDFGIPTFAAVSRDRNGSNEYILFGFGAHFDPKIAMLRALTEANQFLGPLLNKAENEIPKYLTEHAANWWSTATIENQPYLAPDAESPARTADSFSPCWSNDICDDVKLCVKLMQEAGLETLVLDQTQPDVELNVVRVVVPGLRHFWRRLAPGRLYDVPVKLGWLEQPLTEDELNPMSIYI